MQTRIYAILVYNICFQNRSVCEANTCGESQVCTELGSKTLCLIEGKYNVNRDKP